jgi:hypothetical protein
VLAVATIVTVIGMSALTTVRIRFRAAQGGNDVAAGRFYARSAVEMAVFAVSADPDWNKTYTNDAWVSEQAIGDGSYRWKLVDVEDGDLLAEPSTLIRVFGQGRAGDAVRTYSVLIQVDAPANLLSNPGIENGTTDWVEMGHCDLEAHEDEPHSGTACLWVKNRDDDRDGPGQEISSQLTEGATYETEVWVRMKDFTENAWLSIRYHTDSGWTSDYFAAESAGTDWTQVTGSFTASWSGTLIEAYWNVESHWSNQEFKIDDAVVQVTGAGPTVTPIAGTWQRVVK